MHGLLYYTERRQASNEALELIAEIEGPIFRPTGETRCPLCEVPYPHHICLTEPGMEQIWPTTPEDQPS